MNRLSKRRLAICGLGLPLFLFVITISRFAWLQIVARDELMARFQGQVEESYELQTPRGAIRDRHGREMAVSILARSLYGDPLMLNKPAEEVAQFLAPLIGEKPETLTEKLSGRNRFIWLKRGMNPPDAANLQQKIKEAGIQGLGFLEESKRYYPASKLGAGILGFVGTDDKGLYGLEMQYDSQLKGDGVRRQLLTDNLGRPIFDSAIQLDPQGPGRGLELTVDSNIQFICEKWLDQTMVDTKAQGAAIIVMDPKTGAILAMASRPTYDPNKFWDYPAINWRNRAVSTIYEPGSTFKAIVAAVALQEGKTTPSEHFYDGGTIEIGGRTLKNWDGSGLGDVTFTDIVKYSLNTGFMVVGQRVGGKTLNEYARRFGIGKITGIDLPGEEDGILFSDEDMQPIDVATMSIGQGIAVTPMQMISAFGTIANGGKRVQPHIVNKIFGAKGEVTWEFQPGVAENVITQETDKTVVGLLEKVVSEGGGGRAKVPGYRFAGKTGTAEKLNEQGGGYLDGRYIASFAGFGPLEDPQIVVLVIVDDPIGMYYGGLVAAPVFSHVAGEIMQYLGIPPTLPLPENESWVKTQGVTSVLPSVDTRSGQIIVPNLAGLSIRQSANLLAPHGIYLVPDGSGRAIKQDPPPGTAVPKGTDVNVYFSPDVIPPTQIIPAPKPVDPKPPVSDDKDKDKKPAGQ